MSRFFHWTMALLILHQFFRFTERIGNGEHWLARLSGTWHVSLGLLILVLAILRLLWALNQFEYRPRYPRTTQTAVRIGHGLLYLCMLLMPFTGIMYMLSKGHGLYFFDVELIAKSKQGVSALSGIGNLHTPIAWCFLGLVTGHVLLALYHQFIMKDGTLKRMA
nr:cytochrome b [Azomonas macrocytogenes]